MARKSKNLVCMAGIADSDGLESFHYVKALTKEDFGFMVMRGTFNSHRDPVVYKAYLKEADVHKVNDLLNDGMYKAALVELKHKAYAIEVAVSGKSKDRLEASWNRIPYFTHEETDQLAQLANKKPRPDQDIQQMTLFGEEE